MKKIVLIACLALSACASAPQQKTGCFKDPACAENVRQTNERLKTDLEALHRSNKEMEDHFKTRR